MATRLKTVQYAFPTLASLSNNSLTNLSQITIYLPETGAKTIKSAWVELSMTDNITNTGGTVTTKTVNLRLNTIAYSSTTNANTLTHSGESISHFITRDFSNYFATNWTGTSMTCDLQVQIYQTSGTTLGQRNVCATLHITYEYDDASTTQLKTVYMPLNAPTTFLPTTKTSHDTIPALDTFLPENSKVFRNIHIVTQANTGASSTTDFTNTYQLSSLGTNVTGAYEQGMNTDRWVRYVWNITTYITTSQTHTFNVHSSLTGTMDCMQAWMVITYEFNATNTTSVMNSLLLPMEIYSPIGTSATIFQRADREIMIQEPNPNLVRLAAFVRWNNTGNEAGLNVRIGTGSFIAYTNTGSGVIAGGKGLMVRNDNPTGLIFGRGKNTLQLDIYNTATAIKGGNYGALWMINYTSSKASDGVASHNHSVVHPLNFHGTGAATVNAITSSTAISIPEDNYYISALGLRLGCVNNSTLVGCAPSVNIERTVAEGGLAFESGYSDAGMLDSEVGYNESWSQLRPQFKRWNGDTDGVRMDIETPRRYNLYAPNSAGTDTGMFWETFQLYMTYHSIRYTLSGNIYGSSGGTVTINILRSGSRDVVYSTTRVGNGGFSFEWYDNTAEVYAEAYEDGSRFGRSTNVLAPSSNLNINLGNPTAKSFA